MPQSVPDRDAWFARTDSFPRPDWPAIRGWMRAWTGNEERHDTWVQVVRCWMTRLRDALGGEYTIAESEHFHLVSALDVKARERMLGFLENARSSLIRTLGDVAWTSTTGKHVVLRFTDADDYYAYISYFYPEGEHAMSNGVFLRSDYCHIAYPEGYTMDAERETIAHELAHNLLAHLPLPAWLNEALAEAFMDDLAGRGAALVEPDLMGEHRAFWNANTIQGFWAGRSFSQVEGQRVSYSLARILLDFIYREMSPEPEVFRRFVKQSDWNDGGEAAARDQLQTGLGEIAAAFLGPGDWSPKPEMWRKWDRAVSQARPVTSRIEDL